MSIKIKCNLMPELQQSCLGSESSITQMCTWSIVQAQGHLVGQSKFNSNYLHYIDELTTPTMNYH
mgnify:CR=1 FL=1